MKTESLPREKWDTWDPTLISEVSQTKPNQTNPHLRGETNQTLISEVKRIKSTDCTIISQLQNQINQLNINKQNQNKPTKFTTKDKFCLDFHPIAGFVCSCEHFLIAQARLHLLRQPVPGAASGGNAIIQNIEQALLLFFIFMNFPCPKCKVRPNA